MNKTLHKKVKTVIQMLEKEVAKGNECGYIKSINKRLEQALIKKGFTIIKLPDGKTFACWNLESAFPNFNKNVELYYSSRTLAIITSNQEINSSLKEPETHNLAQKLYIISIEEQLKTLEKYI